MHLINRSKSLLTYLLIFAQLVLLFFFLGSSATYAQSGTAFVRRVRAMEPDETGLTNPAGLAYSSRGKAFHAVEGRGRGQPPPAETDVVKLTPFADRVGSARIAAAIKDPINTTFDSQRQRLLIFQSPNNFLIEVLEGPDGNLDPTTLIRHRARRFGLEKPQGMTVDPASGHLFILDTVGPRILRIEPEPDGSFDNAVISEIDLGPTGLVDPRGLAFDPTTGHLHVMRPAEQMLYELNQVGQVVTSRDLSEFGLGDPQGMVFAPSGDLTDDPGEMSLYLADSGLVAGPGRGASLLNPGLAATGSTLLSGLRTFLQLIIFGSGGGEGNDTVAVNTAEPGSGQIVELTFVEPPAVSAPSGDAALVQTIDTSPWPSPDPAGIVYLDKTNTLLVSDSEVNEMPIFFPDEKNLFEMDLSGTLLDTLTIISFSDEPTGVTYNPANGHLFFSDDQGPKSVYELDPGDDGEYDTPDDIVSDFSTQAFNSFDPEGIAFDPIAGVLFIADGTNNELYRVDPGSNGLFDGVPPTGDDQVTSFDTEALGIMDPEGVVFEPDSDNLYLVGAPVTAVAHVTREGELIRLIDISAANPINSAGLAYAPSSLDASLRSLYVVDRGVDNDVDPNENDGKIYEMSIVPLTQGNTAPVVDAGSDQTISLPNPAKLEGTLVADDGVPIAAVMTWSQVTGPGLVTFADVSAVDTTATFTLPGTYVLRLTADDGELAGSDEVTITVTGDAAVSFLDVRITGTEVDNPARSTDDVEEIDNATSSLDRFSGDLDLLFDRGQNRTNKIVGLRFNGVNVPPGATITNAYVQFQVDESTSATTSLTVEGQADDNPATFGFSNKPSPRPRTKAAVSWSPPPWTTIGEAGSDQRTPNMAAIVQEIVDRDGWSRGNSLAIMISGSGERTAVAFEGDPAAAPLLHVEYQLTVPDVVGQPQADAEVAIRDAGLMVGALTSEHSGTVPLGHVISQNPTAGSLVPEGSAVDLVISLGPVTVPDVVGLAQADAQTAIEAAGLTVGTVNQQNSVTVPVGAVISQVPVGGTQVAPGSAVDLVVSRGLATDLGEAGDFAVLGLTGAKIKIEVNNPGVIGDVGLGPNGERELKDGFIAGTFFMDPTAQTKELKTAIKGGAEAKDLAQAVADALQAASDAAALAPTQTFQDIKEARTIEADGELTVVEVNKIELKDGKILTLRGGPDSEFVINISDKLELDNRSAIQLDGSLQASNVLFNFTKQDGKGELKNGSRASGIFLAPGSDAKLEIKDQGSTVVGALIAGKEIKIEKDARVLSPGSEIIPDLREADDFAVLGLTETKIKMDDGNPGVTGDVGLGPNGEGEFKNGSIASTLFVDPTATIKELNIAIAPVVKDLTPAVVDALRASSDAAALAPTQTYQDIKETGTIGSDGNNLTVVAVNKIELKDGKILTLSGDSEVKLVINIADNLKLENGSKIELVGGLQASNVVFNLVKKDASVEIKKGSSASGIFLAPGVDAVLKIEDQDTRVVGALIAAGREISIKKDAQVISP